MYSFRYNYYYSITKCLITCWFSYYVQYQDYELTSTERGNLMKIWRPSIPKCRTIGRCAQVFLSYTPPIQPPPAWAHIFKGVESTSRRTQAAAIAYLYPHHVPNMMHPWIHFRFTTAHNRRIKLDQFLQCVSPPPQFANNIHDDYEKVAIVCDGGIDHHVSKRPPPQPKVSVCFSLILFALCFILIYISPHRVIIHCSHGVFLKSTRTYSPLHCPAFIR